MSTEIHHVLRTADTAKSSATANNRAELGSNPNVRTYRFRESRISLQIVDKHASDKHNEIKALLKPLEFELNSNNPDLIELSEGRIGSLLHHGDNPRDRDQNDFPR